MFALYIIPCNNSPMSAIYGFLSIVLYLIIIIKPEVWIINHCLGLGHETMVCAVCLTMFLLYVETLIHILSQQRLTSLTLGQSYNCLSDSEITLANVGNISRYKDSINQNKTEYTCMGNACTLFIYQEIYPEL